MPNLEPRFWDTCTVGKILATCPNHNPTIISMQAMFCILLADLWSSLCMSMSHNIGPSLFQHHTGLFEYWDWYISPYCPFLSRYLSTRHTNNARVCTRHSRPTQLRPKNIFGKLNFEMTHSFHWSTDLTVWIFHVIAPFWTMTMLHEDKVTENSKLFTWLITICPPKGHAILKWHNSLSDYT